MVEWLISFESNPHVLFLNFVRDSFINDTSQLGYSQDDLDRANADTEIDEIELSGDREEESLLHRQFDNQRTRNDQFKTPVFNRRMKNPETQGLI